MISVNEIRTNLEAIANEVDLCDEGSAALLRDLSQALRGGPQTNAWATSNIYLLINPTLILEAYKKHPYADKLVARLEWLRNTLIFAPLVLTWLGISQAVDQYKALIDAEHDQISQPFIFLWEQGFGNRLPGFLTLGWLAILDFILLFLVLALTFTVYTFSNTVKQRREQQANNLHSKLSYTLGCATLYLATKGSVQPISVVDRLDKVTQDFSQLITPLLKEVKDLADRQKKDWQAFDTLRTQLSTMVTTVTEAVTSIQKSNSTLNQSIDSLNRSVSGVVPAVHEIAKHQDFMVKSTREAIDGLNAQTANQSAVVKEMQNWVQSLQQILTKLEATLDASTRWVQSTGTFTEKQEKLITAMGAERTEQTEIAHHMRGSADNLRRAIQEVNQCAIELRGLNVQLYELVRRVAATVR